MLIYPPEPEEEEDEDEDDTSDVVFTYSDENEAVESYEN